MERYQLYQDESLSGGKNATSRHQTTKFSHLAEWEMMVNCLQSMRRKINLLQTQVLMLQSRVSDLEHAGSAGAPAPSSNVSQICSARGYKDPASQEHQDFTSTFNQTYRGLRQKPSNGPTQHHKKSHKKCYNAKGSCHNPGLSIGSQLGNMETQNALTR
jgi:hypothetical protein